jgi:hypothetical protein
MTSNARTAPCIRNLFFLTCLVWTVADAQISSQVSPAPQGFTPTGVLSNPRGMHTATLLPDGRVLVVGGGTGPDWIDGFWVVTLAELYDPVAGTFSAAGTSAHDYHTATLLQNGRVLIAGGEAGWGPGAYYVTEPQITQGAELYDTVTGDFRSTGAMTEARESHTATLLKDGRVLIAGETDRTRLGSPYFC